MSETFEVSVSCSLTIRGRFSDVKQIEDATRAEVQRAARELMVQAYRQAQQRWLAQRQDRYVGQRWRPRHYLTAWGSVALPTLVVRERQRARGGYHNVFGRWQRGKATRLLSPELERQALEAATQQNYRAAAARVSAVCGQAVSHGLVWQCVQHYGGRLQQQLANGWWPDRPLGRRAAVVVTEIDTAILKWQRRGRRRQQARWFGMHLGLHYTGRQRRYEVVGSDVELTDKSWLVSTASVGIFGRRLRQQRDRHYGAGPALTVLLSDGDAGLQWVRQREFEESIWLLDRWHIGQRIREFVGPCGEPYRRLMQALYREDSEALLEQLRALAPPARDAAATEAFTKLFGYLLTNRDGIDAWRQIPARWKRRQGRDGPTVRAGSGAVEKNVEVRINRRFKRQGRSWNPVRADRLAQLLWLQHQPQNWQHWWARVCLATTKVNPGWPPN